MNAITVLSLLHSQDYEELKRQCEFEIGSMQGKSINASKAREKLARKVAKQEKDRSYLAGAYIIDETQQICDGCAAGVYNDILSGLVTVTDNTTSLFDVRSVKNCFSDKVEMETINLKELKQNIKIAEASGIKRKKQIVQVGDYYFDARYILDYLPTLTGEVQIKQCSNGRTGALLAEGDNGFVFIMSLWGSDEKPIYVVKPKNT